jgi:UDP-N-acetylglucosamine acyltransferase
LSASNIHPTAIIEKGAEIGDGARIGPYAVIGPHVRMGDGCVVQAHAVIMGNTTLGPDNRIHSHAVVGGEPQDRKYRGADTRLVVGGGNWIREGATIHTGTEVAGGLTKIGDDCILMANAHVAHDCDLGSRVILANNVMLAGHTRIEDGAILNGGAGVHHFTTVGTLAYIGGLSRITQDIPPFVIADGRPARPRSVNVIGLKRAGFDDETIRCIKSAFKLLYRSDRQARDALDELREMYPEVAPVQRMVAFVEATEEGRQGRQFEDRDRDVNQSAATDCETGENTP